LDKCPDTAVFDTFFYLLRTSELIHLQIAPPPIGFCCNQSKNLILSIRMEIHCD